MTEEHPYLPVIPQTGSNNRRIGESHNIPSFHTYALATLGSLLLGLGDCQGARECGERAVAVEPGTPGWSDGEPHILLARLALVEGRSEDVSSHLDDAGTIFERTGATATRSLGAEVAAARDLLADEPDRALARLKPIEREFELEMGERQLQAEAMLKLGEYESAAAIVADGVRVARAERESLVVLRGWLRLQGMLGIRTRRWVEVTSALEEGLGLLPRTHYPLDAAHILSDLGALHAARGEPQQARAHWEEALNIYRSLGARPYAERTEQALRTLVGANSGR